MSKEKGQIKKIFTDRGFGFIKTEGKDDMHFRINNVSPLDQLKEGAFVEFRTKPQSNNRFTAVDVKILETKPRETEEGLSSEHYKIPADTRVLLPPDLIDNYNLKLNKVPFFDTVKGKSKFLFKNKNENLITLPKNFDEIVQQISKRQNKLIKDIGCETKTFPFTLDWRLALGLGNESVYETSITLHHLYGIPYLPGQSIKGVIRNYIISEKYDYEENLAMSNQEFYEVFGSQEKKGKVIFFDAFPVKRPIIKQDIMNPHYGEYYSGKEQFPVDYLSPVPIPFLTVENTSFLIHIGVYQIENSDILSRARNWLEEALLNYGIGAKTSIGYGYHRQ